MENDLLNDTATIPVASIHLNPQDTLPYRITRLVDISPESIKEIADAVVERLRKQDTVRVIRCVECRFYRETKGINGVTMTECGVNDGFYDKPGWVWTEPNGYCHKAKRKRVENDVF